MSVTNKSSGTGNDNFLILQCNFMVLVNKELSVCIHLLLNFHILFAVVIFIYDKIRIISMDQHQHPINRLAINYDYGIINENVYPHSRILGRFWSFRSNCNSDRLTWGMIASWSLKISNIFYFCKNYKDQNNCWLRIISAFEYNRIIYSYS